MRKSLWSPDEDEKLRRYVATHGCGNWSDVAKQTGLHRCGKSCRLRWINYLRPDLKRGPFSAHEVRLVVNLHNSMGNSWSKIATHLPGRTDNDVKNFWHSYTRSRRTQQQQYADNNGHHNSDANMKGNDQKVCSSHEQYNNSDMHKSMIGQEHIMNKGHDYEDLMHVHHPLSLPTNTININIKGLAANCIKDSTKSVNNPPQIHLSICKPNDLYTSLHALSHANSQTVSLDHPNHIVSHNNQPDTHLLRTEEANSMNPLINSDSKPIYITNMQPHNQNCSKGSLISFQHFPPLIEASDNTNMINALPTSNYANEINYTVKLQSAVNYNGNSRISYIIPHENSQNPHALFGDNPAASFINNSARSMPANYAAAIKDEAAEIKPPEGLESVIWSFLKSQPEVPATAANVSDHCNKSQYIASNHQQQHHNHVIKPTLALPNYLSSDQSPHQLPSDQYNINVEAFSYTSPSNLQYLQAQYLADCLS